MGINTLEAIAAAALERPATAVATLERPATAVAGGVVSVVMDAQRGDVVAQSFVFRPPQGVESLGAEELISADAWLARLAPGAVVTGPGWGDWRIDCRRGFGRWPPAIGRRGRRWSVAWRLDTMPWDDGTISGDLYPATSAAPPRRRSGTQWENRRKPEKSVSGNSRGLTAPGMYVTREISLRGC